MMYHEYIEIGVGMTAAHYETPSDARKHIKDILDAAESGRPASVRRGTHRVAIVDADRLRYALGLLRPSGAKVVYEAGGWSIFIPGLPIAADGGTFDEVIEEMVDALREHAEDWSDHLLRAPNHAENWGRCS